MKVKELLSKLREVPDDYEVILNIHFENKGEFEAPLEGTATVTRYQNGSNVGEKIRKIILYYEESK